MNAGWELGARRRERGEKEGWKVNRAGVISIHPNSTIHEAIATLLHLPALTHLTQPHLVLHNTTASRNTSIPPSTHPPVSVKTDASEEKVLKKPAA